MKKLTLLFDMDSIIIDLIRPWLDWYNVAHGDKVSIDDITTYNIENHTKKTADIFEFFFEVERYAACPVLPGASEGLKHLHDVGHDIVVATATAGQTANIKWHLVEKAAPFLKDSAVMVGSRKELLKGDVFVDDAPKNVVKYRNAWPDSHILTIAYPYNRDIQSVVNLYAQDHHNTVQAWQQMVDYINNI